MTTIDFALDASRDLVFVPDEKGRVDMKPITGAERIAQALGIRLRAWMGEWYLNLTYGVPYIESILGKQRQELILSVLRAQIITVPGIQQIETLTLDLSNPSRVLTVGVKAISAEGLVEVVLNINT